MEQYLRRHGRIVGATASLTSLLIAYIYVFVVPAETSQISIVQFILSYAHSLCWVFLAVTSTLWGFGMPSRWYRFFAYAGLATYVLFISTFILNKFI